MSDVDELSEFEPCVLFRERRGDHGHWMNGSEAIKVAHRANVLASSDDHYDFGDYRELAGPVALGVLENLENVEIEWCPYCFEIEGEDDE